MARELGAEPAALAGQIDYLFRRATYDLAAGVVRQQEARALQQRAAFEGRGLPEPGEDPELMAIIAETLAPYLGQEPPAEIRRLLVQRIRQHMTLENKRKNLVGEGFEDVLVAIIRRCLPERGIDAAARCPLDTLPGFHAAQAGDKPKIVDVALIHGGRRRTIVTAKWSIRADREEQFRADLNDYVRAKADNQPFSYVLVTNEFDPARLKRACDRLEGNAHMFESVVHINTGALLAAYGPAPRGLHGRRRRTR